MKTYKGKKPLTVIRDQCRRDGVKVSDRLWHMGGDHIFLQGGGAVVQYNTFNGRFCGITDKNEHFSSDSEKHEQESWFQALLAFFYEEKQW